MASKLRESIDSYLTNLVAVLGNCATLRSGFETALTQDFDYWQWYRPEALKAFNAIDDMERGALRVIDALDNIRHADEERIAMTGSTDSSSG